MSHYQQNIDACRQGAIGNGGFTEATLAPLLARAEASLKHLCGAATTLPHLALADWHDYLNLLADYAAAFYCQYRPYQLRRTVPASPSGAHRRYRDFKIGQYRRNLKSSVVDFGLATGSVGRRGDGQRTADDRD